MNKGFVSILLFSMILNGEENPLSIFKPLENYVWKAEGNWGNGAQFKQEVEVEFSLEDKLVKVSSKGFTDEKQTKYGERNHGIRQYDEKSGTIKFWEFDIFGSVTEGVVKGEGRDIIYEYNYGGTLVTDMWRYKDDTGYQFIVGIYENGEWKQKFLDTEFKRYDK